jgi:hypothetical protein
VALACPLAGVREDTNITTDVPPSLIALLEDEPTSQLSFPWNREPWRLQMHDLPDVLATLDQLPERVDRQIIRDVVLSELDAGRVLSAFVPAMVWGWGTTSGQGALRTRWILTEIDDRSQAPALLSVVPSVSDRLEAGVQSARDDGPHEAFRLMKNDGAIKHLGRSYFTKWLYFASALEGPDDAAAAPILDDKITGWFGQRSGIVLGQVDRFLCTVSPVVGMLGRAVWTHPRAG